MQAILLNGTLILGWGWLRLHLSWLEIPFFFRPSKGGRSTASLVTIYIRLCNSTPHYLVDFKDRLFLWRSWNLLGFHHALRVLKGRTADSLILRLRRLAILSNPRCAPRLAALLSHVDGPRRPASRHGRREDRPAHLAWVLQELWRSGVLKMWRTHVTGSLSGLPKVESSRWTIQIHLSQYVLVLFLDKF